VGKGYGLGAADVLFHGVHPYTSCRPSREAAERDAPDGCERFCQANHTDADGKPCHEDDADAARRSASCVRFPEVDRRCSTP
jgi:hypothetical protein